MTVRVALTLYSSGEGWNVLILSVSQGRRWKAADWDECFGVGPKD